MFLGFDRHLVAFLAQGGCDVELVRLADHGVHGNGHMMMIERNHVEALGVLTDWAARKLAHDRQRPQRERDPTRSHGLLSQNAELDGHHLVDDPAGVAPDPDRGQDRARPVEGVVEIGGGACRDPAAALSSFELPAGVPPGQVAQLKRRRFFRCALHRGTTVRRNDLVVKDV